MGMKLTAVNLRMDTHQEFLKQRDEYNTKNPDKRSKSHDDFVRVLLKLPRKRI